MTSPRPLARPVALAGALAIGVLTALQARVNGQLGGRLDDGFLAAAISFGTGLPVILAITVLTRSGRRGVRRLVAGARAGEIRWWMLLGGLAGALTVATQGLAVVIIGVALFTVGVVAGQIVHGLLLDRLGYGSGGMVPITAPRVLGAVLVLVAVGISVQADTLAAVPLWMLVLPLLAGAGIAWQQATNGRLRQSVGTPVVATAVNFLVGAIALTVAAAVHLALNGGAHPLPAEPWLYTGGVIGVVYIVVSVALVAHTGVLMLSLGTVAGQLVAAFVLDLLWPAAHSPAWTTELATVLVALCAVAVAVVPPRRSARAGAGGPP